MSFFQTLAARMRCAMTDLVLGRTVMPQVWVGRGCPELLTPN
jgi:hypothetical protein